MHASRLSADAAPERVAVLLQPATPAEVTPVIMRAYGLTQQERVVTGLVCQGLSTAQDRESVDRTVYTVQDHFKGVFDRTGVWTRRGLVATILRQHYLPPARTGQPVSPTGYFS